MKNESFAYRWRLTGRILLYAVLSLAVIPVFTLIMGTQDNILLVSMSAMGNTSGNMHFWFILWTIVFCAYFAGFMGYLLMLTRNTHSKIRGFVYFAIAVLIVGNIIPFLPETFPGFAQPHAVCADPEKFLYGLIQENVDICLDYMGGSDRTYELIRDTEHYRNDGHHSCICFSLRNFGTAV